MYYDFIIIGGGVSGAYLMYRLGDKYSCALFSASLYPNIYEFAIVDDGILNIFPFLKRFIVSYKKIENKKYRPYFN